MAVEWLFLFWFTPIVYTSMTIGGQIAYRWNKKRLGNRGRIDRVIYQIPTIGNGEECNRILRTIKRYRWPAPVETWIVIDEENYRPEMRFECDRLVIVPKDFQTSCMYKSRSLEYARRLRLKLVEEGRLEGNYVVMQSDDDSTPSEEFIWDALTVNADVVIGTITPRPIGHLFPDYERPVACNMTCLFATNIQRPVWGHGEGMCFSARADRLISYEPSNPNARLISSEDLYILHKSKDLLTEDMYFIYRSRHVSLADDQEFVQKARQKGLTIFASKERVYITPPLTARDMVRQRRRWLWGHIRLIRQGLLPKTNLAVIAFAEASGLVVYAIATILGVLAPLGVVHVPREIATLGWVTLGLWFGFRGYCVGRVMGIKHGLRAALLSFPTVTANFLYHMIGLAKGDPKKFEVIKKYVPDEAAERSGKVF
jgi:hypothetical protein